MKKPNLSIPATRRRINALKHLKDNTTKGVSNDEHRETLMKRISMGKM